MKKLPRLTIPEEIDKANELVAKPVDKKLKGNDLSVKDNNDNKLSIGLEDIDKAITYYFEEKIRPTVFQNDQLVNVPIIYGTPERWKSIQADGYYRDKNSKIMVPLIVFKKDDINQNRNLGTKLDANNPHMYQIHEVKYNAQNKYDRFSILVGRKPSKKYITTIVPDYITITYSCVIFTNYQNQMNKLIEAINTTSDSYWGDVNKFCFRTRINTFSPTVDMESNGERIVKTSFSFTVNGYLIPDSFMSDMNNIPKTFNKVKIVFNDEIIIDGDN